MEATKLKEKELLMLWREDALLDEEGNEIFVVSESGDWTDGGKYQDMDVIFQDLRSEKFYSFNITRSGSYFSHYEFEVFNEAVEVKKIVETITVERWVLV